jgi:hypothetical protein|tara:strand:+ start:3549 stop:3767 length:219 start_codon:yes stop_codon:yes gene_type:complete
MVQAIILDAQEAEVVANGLTLGERIVAATDLNLTTAQISGIMALAKQEGTWALTARCNKYLTELNSQRMSDL